ncbi:hypothetical protein WOSG25_040410 [Weissella oryzae SG25]|uniref:Cysteine desulfurase n=1 Tax=Weissella oryzae (strain DSM 25784 / JCM 18191 / LMG 30913 / SG25) TaxID=1329250 RepID=A0A069CZS1_WEIOS|nr:cysteine desulfurase [Weissella oryzae]GAK30601.1 hypothetical protein WOSG25_040410 [Weissella oryzae SG25]
MAFEKIVKVTGDEQTYAFNPALKKYALSDTGFIQNNAGAYVMQRALEPSKGLAHSIKLKVVINKELTGMKIKTVNSSGTAIVDIFKLAQKDPELIELYHFYLQELIEREIIMIK